MIIGRFGNSSTDTFRLLTAFGIIRNLFQKINVKYELKWSSSSRKLITLRDDTMFQIGIKSTLSTAEQITSSIMHAAATSQQQQELFLHFASHFFACVNCYANENSVDK